MRGGEERYKTQTTGFLGEETPLLESGPAMLELLSLIVASEESFIEGELRSVEVTVQVTVQVTARAPLRRGYTMVLDTRDGADVGEVEWRSVERWHLTIYSKHKELSNRRMLGFRWTHSESMQRPQLVVTAVTRRQSRPRWLDPVASS